MTPPPRRTLPTTAGLLVERRVSPRKRTWLRIVFVWLRSAHPTTLVWLETIDSTTPAECDCRPNGQRGCWRPALTRNLLLFSGTLLPEISDPAALRQIDPAHRLPFVASLPIHYAEVSDRWKYDIVQSIRTRTLLRQEHPAKRLGG